MKKPENFVHLIFGRIATFSTIILSSKTKAENSFLWTLETNNQILTLLVEIKEFFFGEYLLTIILNRLLTERREWGGPFCFRSKFLERQYCRLF
jgi:hypothetical protein